LADITNRSRYRVSVKNRDDLVALFSFNKLEAVEAYMAELRAQHLKPRAEQLEDTAATLPHLACAQPTSHACAIWLSNTGATRASPFAASNVLRIPCAIRAKTPAG